MPTATLFPERPEWVVPTIVQLELSKWLLREKGEDEAERVIDTRLALLAVESHRQHGLAPSAAIVYATAQSESANLLTCDRHFSGLPAQQCFDSGNA